jgi:plastocyanin
MHIPQTVRLFALPTAAILVIACAGGGSAGWTYAPLGPSSSPAASGAASPAGSPGGSPAGSPGGSPGGSPATSGGPGTAVDLETPPDQPLAFVPPNFTVPAGASVTVNYVNNSNLPHNAEFFAGPDSASASLGITADVTGPNAPTSVTFTTPSAPGDYFFWCRIHANAMVGSYTVQ